MFTARELGLGGGGGTELFHARNEVAGSGMLFLFACLVMVIMLQPCIEIQDCNKNMLGVQVFTEGNLIRDKEYSMSYFTRKTQNFHVSCTTTRHVAIFSCP